MKKLSYRIIISGIKEDIEALCKHKGITDPEYIKTVRQKVDDYKGYQAFAAWLYIRNIEPESIVAALDKYVKSRQLEPSKIKISKDKNSISINDKVFEDPIEPIEFTEYIHATYPIMKVEETKQNEKLAKQKAKDEAKQLKKTKPKQENVVLQPIIIDLTLPDIEGCVEILRTGQKKGQQCNCKIEKDNLCKRHYNLKHHKIPNENKQV